MDDLKRRAFEEARADAAHEARAASGPMRRLLVHVRSTVGLARVAMARPWGRPGDRERLAAGAGRDLGYALRRLRQAPAFSVFTVISLSIAIGAATAVYAVVHAVMGPPPGIADPHRVLAVFHFPEGSGPMISLSWPDYEDLRDRQDVFEHLAAWDWTQAGYVANGMSGSATAERVTGEYFDTLGVRAAVGRTLRSSDDDPAAPPAAVISHRLWRQVFAESDRVLDDTIRVDGADFQIVGVAAADFRGLFNGGLIQTAIWLPMGATRNSRADAFDPQSRDRRWVMVRGRLAPDRTVDQATARVAAIARQLDAEYPLGVGLDPRVREVFDTSRTAWTVKPAAGRLFGVPDVIAQRLVTALLAAVGLVLLVAATNLSNLSIARATRRRHDLSIQTALGASRWRLVREVLSESLLLALAGGALGLLVAQGLMQVLSTELSINGASLQFDPRFDARVLLWTLGATSLVLIVAGLVPALLSTRALRSALASEGVTTAGPWRGRRALIALQVTVSVTLVMLASTFVAQVRQQAAIDTGLDLERLALAEIDFGRQRYEEEQVRRLVHDVMTRMRRPGVESVAVSSGLPVSLITPGAVVQVDGVVLGAQLVAATPDIATTLGLSLVHGRLFDERDATGPPVIVLNEETAIRLFGTRPAVGQFVTLTRRRWVGDPPQTPKVLTLIGVVSDTDARTPGRRDEGVVYLPLEQHYEPRLVVSVRAAGNPGPLVVDLRQAIAAVDPGVAVAQIGTGSALVTPDTLFQRIAAGTAGLLGAFALMLALAGLYGVMAHLVSARTREVGVRIALGASAVRIQRMVMREGLAPVLIGLAAGLGLAFLAGLAARATLRGLELHAGVGSLVSVAALFVLSGAVACYLPARFASRIDPNQALKSQ